MVMPGLIFGIYPFSVAGTVTGVKEVELNESLDLILAVVPNGELDAFAEACRVRTFWLQRTPGGERAPLSHWCLFYWLYRCVQEYRIPLESEVLRACVPFHVEHRDPELPVDLTPPRWQMFIDGYFDLMESPCLKWPDHQIIVSHIPPAYILGVIIISDSRRLLPHAHHQHGKYQPLARTLWRMAHDMRKTYRGKPIVRHLQEYSK